MSVLRWGSGRGVNLPPCVGHPGAGSSVGGSVLASESRATRCDTALKRKGVTAYAFQKKLAPLGCTLCYLRGV
ncbi:hypothetical protein BFW01_g8881 [Lasiodiplodia theobromae]|nr:hypothetical protein BFW01_g8881 [Lasiodiplodia theobromae]